MESTAEGDMTEPELAALERRIISAIKEQTHESIKDTGRTWVIETVERTVPAAVEATFIQLGLDCKKPFEAQKDFAHLRTIRTDSEDRRKIVVSTITKWGLGLFLAAVSAGSGVIAALKIKP